MLEGAPDAISAYGLRPTAYGSDHVRETPTQLPVNTDTGSGPPWHTAPYQPCNTGKLFTYVWPHLLDVTS